MPNLQNKLYCMDEYSKADMLSLFFKFSDRKPEKHPV